MDGIKYVRSVNIGRPVDSKAGKHGVGLEPSANESVLSRLLPDLARAWSKHPAQVDLSRIYGKDGVIHDPRTGVTSNRIKEVWKGNLDEFLEGWRRTRG